MRRPFSRTMLVWLLIWLPMVQQSFGYSVLTHEEIVDLVWKDRLQPLLLKRFPKSSEEDLRKAHAFAYGGSLIQDMGYYPFGNGYFSDLVHYVRTGDFVINLVNDSSDLNEYAFALGALAHYSSDNVGHPTINRVVAISFPKLRKKFGPEVTYSDDPKAHIRTEFGFDMVQVAKNRYTSDRYHDFIGFEIAKPLLERAFAETYGIELKDVISNEDLAIGTFRRSISAVIPEMTRVALLARKKEIVRDTPNFNEKKFLYHLSRADYEKNWGIGYRHPGVGARILALFLKFVPKVGPFRALGFQIPTTQTEDMYIKSINETLDNYGTLLSKVPRGHLQLASLDCDTGKPAKLGEYPLADKTYARWLDELSKRGFNQTPPDVKANILAFYDGAQLPVTGKNHKESLQKAEEIKKELDELRASLDNQH